MDFAVLADHRVKLKESEKRDKYLDFARELKHAEHEGDGDTNCNWRIWNNPQRIGTETGKFGNKKTSEGHPDSSIIMIGQNTEKSLEELKIFDETWYHLNFRGCN